MALRKWAYIFLSPGFNPETHTMTMESDTCQFIAIGMSMDKKESVLAIAQRLVAEGTQLIELCGGFGPIWIAKVTEAIGGAIPVGSVAYGPEARKPMLDIFSTK